MVKCHVEIEIIKGLQAVSGSFWRWLLAGFSVFGSELFFIFVFLIWFWCINKREAAVLFVAYSACMGINLFLKEIFKRLRPHEVNNAVQKLDNALGYSMPSGHVQGFTFTASGLYFLRQKNDAWRPAILAAGALGAIAVSISRMFCGAHYLSDCLVAIIIGVTLGFLFIKLLKNFKRIELLMLFIGAVAGSALIIFFVWKGLKFNVPRELAIAGGICGVGAGYVIERFYINFKIENFEKPHRIVAGAVGILLTFGFYALTLFLGTSAVAWALRFLFTMFFATTIPNLILKFIFKRKLQNV